MNKFLENLAALLKVKTIVTLLLTVVFCVLALTGVISGADFLTVFTVVIAFYFGTQQAKTQPADPLPSAQPLPGVLIENTAVPTPDAIDPATYNQTHPDESTAM